MKRPQGVSPELWAIVERTCTVKEQEALELKALGFGVMAIARRLGISKTSARERLENASRKIQAEVAAMRGIHADR